MTRIITQTLITILVLLLIAHTAPAQEQAPVLLIHGLYGNSVNFAVMKLRLIREGYTSSSIYSVNLTPNDTVCDPGHVAQINTAVENIITETGITQIDVIGHSNGGLDLLNYMLFGTGVGHVRNFIAIGSPLQTVCWANFGSHPTDMTPGDTTRYTSVHSLADEVVPSQLAFLEGARNVEVAEVSHSALLYDKNVFSLVLEGLRGGGLNDDIAAAPAQSQAGSHRSLSLTWATLRK